MTIQFKPAAAITAVLCLASATASRADVTLTMKMTMHSAMLDQAKAKMTEDQAAAMEKMLQSTLYLSGKRSRTDTAMMSIIVDAGTKQMTMMNPTQHRYYTMPMNPAMLKQAMGSVGVPTGAGAAPTYKVTDTGKTTQYLGHTCRHYILAMTMTIPNAGTMTMHSDVLAAQDLPGLDPDVYQTLSMQMGVKGEQMKGVPLMTETKMTGGMIGEMSMTQKASDISTDPIPASEFEVPSDYTQASSLKDVFTAPSPA
jgi:hypothetical protein